MLRQIILSGLTVLFSASLASAAAFTIPFTSGQWTADFESPNYTTGYLVYATGSVSSGQPTGTGGQQYWWNSSNFGNQGYVTGGQLRLGSGANQQAVISPYLSDVPTDSVIRISYDFTPSGSTTASDWVYGYSSNGNEVSKLTFKTDGTVDFNGSTVSGITVVGGTQYQIEIIKDDINHTYDLSIDGTKYVTGQSFSGLEGFRNIKVNGGGDSKYAYIDNIAVAVPEPASGGLMILGASALLAMRRRRR